MFFKSTVTSTGLSFRVTGKLDLVYEQNSGQIQVCPHLVKCPLGSVLGVSHPDSQLRCGCTEHTQLWNITAINALNSDEFPGC